uniref:actin-like n=1 Tax=Styela clava TaxID=7725 RepID=UPI00193A09D9|nr:actin-like [Styela clava]
MTPAIIIDSGSANTKLGSTGDEEPQAVLPTVSISDKKTRLIERGLVTNWDEIEKFWQHCIENELKMDPTQNPIFLTEPPLNPQKDRERQATMLFEKFNTPKMSFGFQPVLALYAYGKMAGFVLDIGYGTMQAVPCEAGFFVPKSYKRSNHAGQDLDFRLKEMMQSKGCDVSLEVASDIKEKLCYATQDYDAEMKKAEDNKQYKLPDGKEIAIGRERFQCPEHLFQPQLGGSDVPSVQKLVCDAVETQGDKTMFENIVLTGGSTMFPGIKEWIEKEITALLHSQKVIIQAHDTRKFSSFIGSAILTALPTFEPLWITKQQYEEIGTGVVAKIE